MDSVGKGLGSFLMGWGGGSRELYTVQVRSLLLQLSQILVSFAEGMVLLEASPGGLGDVPPPLTHSCNRFPWRFLVGMREG